MIQIKSPFGTVVLLLIGIGFIAATTVRMKNTLEFISKAKTADGVVIVTQHAKSHPRIEYTNASGEKRWFLANEWITGFRIISFKTGEHVRVLYDPADPAAFSVDDFLSLYLVPIAGGITSIVFVVLGLCALTGKITIQTKDMFSAVPILLVGIGFITAGFAWTKDSREFIGKAKITDGVVVDMSTGSNHPEIGYINSSGEKDEFPANGQMSGYKVGEHVRVLYDPANPAHPKIDDFGSLYGLLYLASYLGGGFFVMGLLAVFGGKELIKR
jgi:hypothetical protein